MLNNAVNRERLMGYAEDVLLPATVKDITLMETVEEEGEELSLWLVTMEDEEEYWLLENGSPCGIYKRSGIYESSQRVFDTYAIQKEQAQQEPVKDRFAYGYEK